ncbi:PREDICTED: zinc finger protein 518B [Elephantulus edwardii]|uniref:zinc finger protein 518B n=1 Tax=Elephantulus edwardii TaxID=28737 RepID=UPI0003F060BE|nr:PREDICTED: zinc finger protein 518B [Elephantulus edwardii]
MQIKKMKDPGHSLYTPQVNERHSSVTMSPKQPNTNKMTQPERQDAQALLYPGTESEAAMVTVATCVKCKNVHKVLLQDFLRGPGQNPKDDTYVCFQCSLGVPPPPFHFMNGNSGVAHISSQAATIASPLANKFKARNYNPDKYYCDKCRFSTKDPLQYKKHMLQHDEIKFICSHCSHISYTKGAFQRHLVKHTGVFPYQCEYCEYGAIRNDYIVKHRKRVHEKDGDKRSPKTITKSEPKRTSTSKQYSEPLRTSSVRATFHNRLSDQLSRFSLHANKGKTPNITLLPEAKESQKDVVCIPNKVTVSEPGDTSVFENKNVEVEVLSPAKEPVQPGMPLTVVAPSELVVPANCLAQLLDVKVVNGTQQVVLKLFPLEENSCLEAGVGGAGNSELATREKVASEQGENVASEQTSSSPMEDRGGKLAGLDPLQSSMHKQVRNVQWAKSYDFFSRETSRRQGDSFLDWKGVEGLQKRNSPHPHRTAPPAPVAFKAHGPPPIVKTNLLCGPGTASSLFPYKDAVPFPEDGWSSHRSPHPLLPLASRPTATSFRPAATSFRGERGAVSNSDLESRSELSIPLKILSSIRKAGRSWPEAALGVSQLSSPHESECLHINLGGKDRLRGQPEEKKPLEFKSPERSASRFEGPVISSVFSLSSGSENIPEGIKWNGATSKIKSIEMLRRKIAQLIESCGKPSSLTTNSIHRRSAGPLAKTASKAVSESTQDVNMAAPSSGYPAGPLQKSWDGGTVGTQLPGEQVSPQFVESRKAPVAAPVLIPKGAVLRVLHSSEDARIIEATCEAPVIPCDETQMVSPLPFLSVKQADLSLQTSDSGPIDMSQNPETLPRLKPKRESSVCGTTAPRKAAPLQGPQGSSERSKPGKLLSRNLAVSRRKTKQTNSSRKKNKLQADPSHYLKDPSIFQVARQLRLVAVKPDQLIKCPRRNQPVIVLNHPDVDSLEVTNVMKVINKYKGNVLKVVLSERTRCQLGIKRHQVRLTYQNSQQANQIKRQLMLKMKLKKVHKNNDQMVETLPDDSSQCVFKCWFCGRQYEDQEEWMSHGQRHLIEATRDWDVLSSKGK